MLKLTKNTLLASTFASVLLACGGGNSNPDSDQDDLYYEFKEISSEDALNTLGSGGLLKNPNNANINSNLDDWQLLDLTAYAMQVYDLSQQTHNIAYENYDMDLTNKIDLLKEVITYRVTGFTKNQFNDLIDLQDLCNTAPELPDNPVSMNIESDVKNEVNATQRDAKVRFNLTLAKCQYNYKEGVIDREQYAYGNLSYDNFIFKNNINSDLSETTQNIVSSIHGTWLVLSETMGYQDSLGYWLIHNIQSNSNYDITDQDPQVKTTNLRTDFYLRDGFRNFDHLYKIEQPSGTTILTHLGSKNPYSGSLEIRTDHEDGRKLVIKFSENTVDILINDDVHLNDVSWTDIRSRKLDMTFDYAND